MFVSFFLFDHRATSEWPFESRCITFSVLFDEDDGFCWRMAFGDDKEVTSLFTMSFELMTCQSVSLTVVFLREIVN